MAGERDYLDGLTRLHLLDDQSEQRATWRRSLATLARTLVETRTVPLEGLRPKALSASLRAAFNANLIDDLEFLSPAAAAAVLYELAAALPHGWERRELGRRVLERLLEGTAETFVSVATLLSQGNSRALSGAQIRARVTLALELPFGLEAQVDALALALISRRDLQREWLTFPSTGSLPSRRLAARLLERAAREAARRSAAGDDTGVRIFSTAAVRSAWDRLLTERESLVWRHVAVARGLLSVAIPSFNTELERHLDPNLTPTEWRRAAASLAGRIALRPDEAVRRGHEMLEGKLISLDRGVASAMILGLPRAAEVEPAAVEELLETLVRVGSVASAEALVELRREQIGPGFGRGAAELARAHLRKAGAAVKGVDDGKSALVEALESELDVDGAEQHELPLRDQLSHALDAFANLGSRQAFEVALDALDSARSTMTFLEGCTSADSRGRRWGFRALRELDTGLLETAALAELLTLGDRSGQQAAAPLGALFERLSSWLVAREGAPLQDARTLHHLSIRLRQLRTMLHLVDADGSWGEEGSNDLRRRRLLLARVLLRRARDDVHSPLRRTVTAAAARACDALVREELCEVSDVVIAGGHHLRDEVDLTTLAEASMVPEIETAARAYAQLARALGEVDDSARGTSECLEALQTLAHELPLASSRRVEALRSALNRYVDALETINAAASLEELIEGDDPTTVGQLEDSTLALSELTAGALRRLDADENDEASQCAAAVRMIDLGIEHALKGSRSSLDEGIDIARDVFEVELLPALSAVGRRALVRLAELPARAESSGPSRRSVAPRRPPLPPWLPPGRSIGGFYVLRALGSGSAASVFVVKRVEERSNPSAERMALKVPEYDGSAALTLSEEQFLRLFREEASALLTLPEHPNLARFITFDAGARPKPILVMELVEGPTLERTLTVGDIEVEAGLTLLDGIASALEGMHAVGVGHHDLKPSNVILRRRKHRRDPVLVDLGLAGRQLRPGCGTPNYAAPEIWGVRVQGHEPTPLEVDVYAFGCLIFEVLTDRLLFDALDIGDLQRAHVEHDGDSAPLLDLCSRPALDELGQLIIAAVRRDPRKRPSIAKLRRGLTALAPQLTSLTWPLGGSDPLEETLPRLSVPVSPLPRRQKDM